MILLALIACGEPLLTEPVSAELGQQLCKVGHPNAECGRGRRAGWSGGGCSNKDKTDRWLDVAVPYTRKGEEHEMVIRVRLKSVSPCKAAVDVQSDDGPNPVLLDNAVTSKLVGDVLCDKVTL